MASLRFRTPSLRTASALWRRTVTGEMCRRLRLPPLTSKPAIVLVEDEPVTRTAVRRLLEGGPGSATLGPSDAVALAI